MRQSHKDRMLALAFCLGKGVCKRRLMELEESEGEEIDRWEFISIRGINVLFPALLL